MNERAASFAALASVFLAAESFLIYSAGQLATTSAAPIYLNALPYLFEWVRFGRWRAFLKGTVLFMAAAAAHHATLLFGSMFFALPVLALVLSGPREWRALTMPGLCTRTDRHRRGGRRRDRRRAAPLLDRPDPQPGHAGRRFRTPAARTTS